MKTRILILLCLLTCFASSAQKDSIPPTDLSAYVQLDSIMIEARRNGFSIEEFIQIIQNDKSLETSFNNLRLISYQYVNDLQFFNKKGHMDASYKSTNRQVFRDSCQFMNIEEETISGKYFKKSGDYRYLTSKFYDRVFFRELNVCKPSSKSTSSTKPKRIFEKRVNELKKLIYSPGSHANVPLIGSKTAIFSDKMVDKYQFSIHSQETENGDENYVFLALIKPDFNDKYPNASILKYLEITMTKDSQQVLSRKYKLQYNSGLYDFDILISVDLSLYKDLYIPSEITYKGYWNMLGKKKENCNFQFKIIDFL